MSSNASQLPVQVTEHRSVGGQSEVSSARRFIRDRPRLLYTGESRLAGGRQTLSSLVNERAEESRGRGKKWRWREPGGRAGRAWVAWGRGKKIKCFSHL